MWYPAKVTEAATAEPVTLDEVKRRLRIGFEDGDTDLGVMLASARDHVEKYCNISLATQTVEIKCDDWADMMRLPIAPVKSVTSIAYVAVDGTDATVDLADIEERFDGLEAAIVPAYGKQWPAAQRGSRITVTAVVGYDDAPAAVKHAMLLWIADAYETRENAKFDDWTALDALLCNFRRGA